VSAVLETPGAPLSRRARVSDSLLSRLRRPVVVLLSSA
jgi:hypothetical protein